MLTLKRASKSRPSGQWPDDDHDDAAGCADARVIMGIIHHRNVPFVFLLSAGKRSGSSSRVYTRFFLAAWLDVFFVLAFFFGAARFLAATLFTTFFFAGEVVVAPSPANALAPLAALASIAILGQ
jgi:hypothetical protein